MNRLIQILIIVPSIACMSRIIPSEGRGRAADHSSATDEASTLEAKVKNAIDRGRYCDAVALAERFVGAREKTVGKDDPGARRQSIVSVAQLRKCGRLPKGRSRIPPRIDDQ